MRNIDINSELASKNIIAQQTADSDMERARQDIIKYDNQLRTWKEFVTNSVDADAYKNIVYDRYLNEL